MVEMQEAVDRCALTLTPQERTQLTNTLAAAGLPHFLEGFKAGRRLF